MNQNTKTIIKSLAFFLVFALVVVSINVYGAFTPPPPGNPGDGNVETPINTSEAIQIKKGGLIVAFERVLGILLVGGKAEFADTIKIYGGNPGVNKVLVSDAVGLASWVDPSTLPGWGGTPTTPPPPPPAQGVVPVSLGGTGLTTAPNNSILVANSLDTYSSLNPGAGNSIRLNSAGSAWEGFTPLTSNGNGGTINVLSKFTGPHTLGDSGLTDDGSLITAGSDFRISRSLSFSTLVLQVNDSNTTNFPLGSSTYIQISKLPPYDDMTIQGFAPPSGQSHLHGRVVYITNQNSSVNFTIKNNSNTTALANRVQTINNSDMVLGPRETIMLFYDAGFPGGSRWRVLFGPSN